MNQRRWTLQGGRGVRAGAVVLTLGGGCFSEPPAGGSGAEGSTSASVSTGAATSSGSSSISGGTVATTEGAASSSSSDGSGSTTTTTGADDTSSTSTGPGAMCSEEQVPVGSLCLTPLVVAGANNEAEPASPGPLARPCLRATCPDGLALGGGFALENMFAHASHRDPEMEGWNVCAGPEGGVPPNLAQAHVRCANATGDVIVNTETFAVSGASGLACHEAQCPAGTTLIGGGGRWGPNFVFQGSEPRLDGTAWEVCGLAAGVDLTVEVDAHCAVLPPGAEAAVYEDVQPVSIGETGCAQVGCSDGIAITGGVNAGISMVPVRSFPDGEQWVSCGRSAGNFTVDVRSRVLCLSY